MKKKEKFKRIMKNKKNVIIFFSIVIFLGCFNTINAQEKTITIKMENVSLGEILQEIKKQSGKNILYNNNRVDIYKKESINIENLTLTEALDECLRNKDL
ncbi:MAG: STN domain-containing protein, partial [Bacteroidales bacterium]|nr:STN domain-containing protein [Bacteroidales bacterium]